MEFSPNNPVVKLCLQGMGMEERGDLDAATNLFLQAWNEATDDLEKFIAAYYVARRQTNTADKLQWLETALQFALRINDDSVKSAFPGLYADIAQCYEELGDADKARTNAELAHLRLGSTLLTAALLSWDERRFTGGRSADSRGQFELQTRTQNESHLFYGPGQWSGAGCRIGTR
ncbi:MAG: hypothetical protein R3A10_13445 [Caldilineaceae bacterium]